MRSNIDDMIVNASLNNRVVTLRGVETVSFWRAMGDDVERRIPTISRPQRFFVSCVASITMLMSLQHKFCFSFSDDVVEHPSLNEVVVLSSHGIKRMVEKYYAVTGIRLLYLLFQPLPLLKEIEKLTFRVKKKELCVMIIEREKVVLVFTLLHTL